MTHTTESEWHMGDIWFFFQPFLSNPRDYTDEEIQHNIQTDLLKPEVKAKVMYIGAKQHDEMGSGSSTTSTSTSR